MLFLEFNKLKPYHNSPNFLTDNVDNTALYFTFPWQIKVDKTTTATWITLFTFIKRLATQMHIEDEYLIARATHTHFKAKILSAIRLTILAARIHNLNKAWLQDFESHFIDNHIRSVSRLFYEATQGRV